MNLNVTLPVSERSPRIGTVSKDGPPMLQITVLHVGPVQVLSFTHRASAVPGEMFLILQGTKLSESEPSSSPQQREAHRATEGRLPAMTRPGVAWHPAVNHPEVWKAGQALCRL